jgi:hypothetical protein
LYDPDDKPIEVHNPPGLVFAAVAIGGLGIGFGIAATVLMLKSQANVAAPSATVVVPKPLPSLGPAPRASSWTDELHASVCPAPCCGGAACRVSADNAGRKDCKEGETNCQACASKLSCIPGACDELFDGEEELGLHLSAVLERGPSGQPIDACKSRRDLWLCVKRATESEWQCLSQREACSNQSRSPAAVNLQAVELTRKGLQFEVREGSPDGTVLARKHDALSKSALQRRGMCGGFRADFEPGPVTAFYYFLDQPPGADAPQSIKSGTKDAGADAGPADAAADSGAAPMTSAGTGSSPPP